MEGSLEKMDITNPPKVENWHDRFGFYCAINPKITLTNKTSYYLTLIGEEAYDLLKTLCFPEQPISKDVTDLQAILIQHIKPAHFEATERAYFYNLIRKTEEPLRDFLLRLQRQASKCNFGAELPTQMRDRIISGVNDLELQKRLLQEPGLDFDRAKAILETWEDVNRAVSKPAQVVLFNNASGKRRKGNKNPPINFRPPRPSPQPLQTPTSNSNSYPGPSQSFRTNQRSFQQTPTSTNQRQRSGKCDSCGGTHLRMSCKFRHSQCFKCNRPGHIAAACRSFKSVKVHTVTEQQSEEDFQVMSVNSNKHLYHPVTFASGKTINFIIDTGSPISFLPASTFENIGLGVQIQPSSANINGVSGHSLPVQGQIRVPVQDSKSTNPIPITFIITKSGPSILGLDGLRELNVDVVLQTSTSNSQPTSLSSEIKKLIHSCSNNSGGMNVPPVTLETTETTPKFYKARPMAFGLRPAVQQGIKDLVASGILSPVQTSAWGTPIVTPLKSNGLPRICGDFRVTVNPFLKQPACTTPEVEDMLSGLRNSKIFSKIDLTNAFLQIPLAPDSKELTTIHTLWGLYQHNYLPFGLSASPGLFQQTLDNIISHLRGVRSYQDDIIVHGSTQLEHDQNLLHLLQALKHANVQINAKKSIFGVPSLRYLGYRISGQGITPDIERFKAIQLASKPTTFKELQSFMGFSQYYSRFVPSFSDLAKPLFDLLTICNQQGNDKAFTWTEQTDAAYNALINAIISNPTLKSFDIGQPSELYVDASEIALGAVLEQSGHPVLFISRRLTTAEQNYSQTQREALAIVWAVKRMHKYLFGTHFKIITDHKALEFIFNPTASITKATSAMLQRWSLDLSAYNYDIEHRPGKRIPHADYLSRFAHQETTSEDSETAMFTNPLPINRNHLIQETKLAYGPVISAVRNGWSISARRRFPKLYSQRHNLTMEADGVLLVNELTLIPPTCRQAMLNHLHLGHLGRDKMKSLSRLLCYWPTINSDIALFANDCISCKVKPRTHPNWKPWPTPFSPMQRIHADYCGPFLSRYYALIIQDSFSKFPEVFVTDHATASFSKLCFQTMFAREGIPQAIVTDNGTHFTAIELQNWLQSIGCQCVFTPPRHPCSNGQAESFVKTLKTAVAANEPTSLDELRSSIATFLLQYRNSVHPATGKTPAMLFKGRNLRTSANIDTTEVLFYRGNDNRPCQGLLIRKIGDRLFYVMDRQDGSVHRRHIDQVQITPATTHPIEHTLTHTCVEPTPLHRSGSSDYEAPRVPERSQLPVSPASRPPPAPSAALTAGPPPLVADPSSPSPRPPPVPTTVPPVVEVPAAPVQSPPHAPGSNIRRSHRQRKPPERLIL